MTDAAMSLNVIQEVGPGGSDLTHMDTFDKFKNPWRPTVSCWDFFNAWEKKEKESILVRASKKYKEILGGCPEMMITPELDRDPRRFLEKARGPS